jgi:hypothetical protein
MPKSAAASASVPTTTAPEASATVRRSQWTNISTLASGMAEYGMVAESNRTSVWARPTAGKASSPETRSVSRKAPARASAQKPAIARPASGSACTTNRTPVCLSWRYPVAIDRNVAHTKRIMANSSDHANELFSTYRQKTPTAIRTANPAVVAR